MFSGYMSVNAELRKLMKLTPGGGLGAPGTAASIARLNGSNIVLVHGAARVSGSMILKKNVLV